MLHASNRFTRAASVLGVAAGLSVGAAGIAVAATGGSGSAAHHQQVTPTPVAPLPGQDTTGQGQGNSDYTPPGEHAETPDPGEAKTNEAESANDPEPSHQDNPNDPNVDHTPAGETPEPPGTGSQG